MQTNPDVRNKRFDANEFDDEGNYTGSFIVRKPFAKHPNDWERASILHTLRGTDDADLFGMGDGGGGRASSHSTASFDHLPGAFANRERRVLKPSIMDTPDILQQIWEW